MSRDVDISFRFSDESEVRGLLESLSSSGWRADDHGVARYLVDPDMFDWSAAALADIDAVCEELEERRIVGHSYGVILTWRETMIGGQFIFSHHGKEMMFTPSINTVKRSDSDFVDFEWYLQRLLPALSRCGLSGYVATDVGY